MAADAFRLALDYVHRLAGPGGQASVSDGELLRRYVRGRDQRAFAVLVERHGPLVLATCRRALGDAHLAEDCFQATFQALSRQAPSLNGRSSLAGWLYTVARRGAHKVRVRNLRPLALPPALTAAGCDPLAELSGRELCALLDAELARLPGRYREPIVLCCLEGLARDEAARRLGWSLNAFRGRLERGRMLLRKRLEQRGVTLPAALAVFLLAARSTDAVPPALAQAALRRAMTPFATSTLASTGFRATLLGWQHVLGVVLLLAAAGGAGWWVTAGGAVVEQAHEQVASSADILDEQHPAGTGERVDLYGDPLPDGAIVRMGSTRLRHASLTTFVFLAGGKQVVTAGSNNVLRFWDTTSGRQVREVRLEADPRRGTARTFSPNGKYLAGSAERQIVLWDVESGKKLKVIPGTNGAELTFTPDGKILAELVPDGPTVPRTPEDKHAHVILHEWETLKKRIIFLPTRKIGYDSTYHLRFSPDGRQLAAGGGCGEALCVYETATGKEVKRFLCDASTSTFTPDGKRLAVACMPLAIGGGGAMRGAALHLFDIASGKEVLHFPLDDEQFCFSLVYAPDGNTLACGFWDKNTLVDGTTGRVLRRLPGIPVNRSFSPDGKILAGNTGQRLRFWDPVTGNELQDRPGEFSPLVATALSPDAHYLVAGDWSDLAVRLWDTTSGRLIHSYPFQGADGCPHNLAFSSDGRTFIGSGYGERSTINMKHLLRFRDVTGRAEQRSVELKEPERRDKGYNFHSHLSTDDRYITSLETIFDGEEHTRLALWETASGKLVTEHTLRSALSRFFAWQDDGKAVALALRKGGLSVVDVESGENRIHIPGDFDGPLAASPDFRLLAAHRAPASDNASSASAATIDVRETITGKKVTTAPDEGVTHLALAPDNRHLITADRAFLRVIDLATGKESWRRSLGVAMPDSAGEGIVRVLYLSPDGERAITILHDGTGLVWDIRKALAHAELPADVLAEKSIATWWEELASDDAGRAYGAVWRMVDAPADVVVPFLVRHLPPAGNFDAKKVRQLIADLDNDAFSVRESAFKQLEAMRTTAELEMRRVLAAGPSAEVRRRLEALLAQPAAAVSSPGECRRLRSIQVLEQIGSTEARRVLSEIAEQGTSVAEVRDAKAGLYRMSRRR
jgi:RNA polymerase sigma factor (sigma-70 family)